MGKKTAAALATGLAALAVLVLLALAVVARKWGGGRHRHPSGPDTSLALEAQPASSLQIVNKTSEDFLHVFLQIPPNMSGTWAAVSGNGKLQARPIHWGVDPGAKAWDPLGAKKTQELVLPKGGHSVLTLPDAGPFIVMAVKMANPGTSQFLAPNAPWGAGRPAQVLQQFSNLIEAGKDVVADSSAVDGVNFRVEYELTSDHNKALKTWMAESPCKGLSAEYQAQAGCRNPAKVDCGSAPSCDCQPKTQICCLNDCSSKLFEVPAGLEKYRCPAYDPGNSGGAPVKSFINRQGNLRKGSPLAAYCAAANGPPGVGFSTYCYDYNDPGSSPWLRSPYKMKVAYLDV